MAKILSLAGGGSRGVLSICMLKVLEQSLPKKHGVEFKPIQSYFDYITGTSIGGLEAAALSVSDGFGEFKYNATYLCDHLTHRSQDIFSDTHWFSFGGVARPKYSREPLTGLLKELLGDTKLSDSAVPMRNSHINNSSVVKLLKMMSGVFNNARASGGNITQGTPYLVGERGPEVFIPNSGGHVLSNNSSLQERSVNVVMNINGGDVSGFQKSRDQIISELASAIQRAKNV